MKVLWAIICEGSSVDRESNNVSLFNVLEQIQIPEPPAVDASNDARPAAPIPYRLVVLFCRSDQMVGEKGTARIALRFPTEEEPVIFPQSVIDLEVAQRNRLVSRFPFLPVSGEGTYKFVIEELTDSVQWQELFEVPVEVSFQVLA